MSGDVQPRKRNKDKKRKKDDEDTVKETPAPRAPSAGAAQAAKEPGDIQMHVHDDHGTGGHWCAKIVFFILLAGLGALIGLIIIENQGASDVDTPLSESRYAEYLTGWVDENREDDHHHEDILNALNELDDHDDDHGEDHDDDAEHDEQDGDEDDGAPYTEEEDHDDAQDEDEEDEGEVTIKLDDDEVEEIVATERKIREAEAADAADDEDDDEEPTAEADGNDDDEDNDEEEAIKSVRTALDNDDDDDNNDDGDNNDDDDNDDDDNNDNGVDDNDDNDEQDLADNDNDDDGDDNGDNYGLDDDAEDEDSPFDEEDDNIADDEDFHKPSKFVQANDDDDDEENVDDVDDDDFDNFVDNDDGEEEYLAKVKSEQEQKNQQKQQQEKESSREESSLAVQILVGAALIGAARLVLKPPGGSGSAGSPSATESSGSSGNQSSSQQLNPVAAVEVASSIIQERLASSENTVSSMLKKAEDIEQLLKPAQMLQQTRSVLEDFVNAGPASDEDEIEIIEGNVILIEADDGELYSGDDYEIEEYDEDFLEEIEEEEEEDDAALQELEQKKLEEQEREIGTFVPTTFEEFSAMYRAPQDSNKEDLHSVHHTVEKVQKTLTKSEKESPLMKKKPPKGAVGKLIYGLHKDPILVKEDTSELSFGADKGEAKTVLEAMLSEIHSPPQPPSPASQSPSIHAVSPDPTMTMTLSPSSTASIKILTTTITPVTSAVGSPDRSPAGETVATSSQPVVKEKHVEFLLPGTSSLDSGSVSEEEPVSPLPVDNGSKENLFIPYDDGDGISGEFPLEEEYEDELIYDEEEYLRQYGSDEEEELYSDHDDEPSDVDDSELMLRLEEKYGKLEVKKNPPAEPAKAENDEDEGSWTKIPSRQSGSLPYAEELKRAEQQLDEEFGFE